MRSWKTAAILGAATLGLVVVLSGACRADDELAPLSDEFNDPNTLTSWQRVYRDEKWGADQLARLDINRTQPGCLTMVPHTSVWYRDFRGELTYKLVTGDFVVTTRLRVTGRNGRDAPRSMFSLGGLMMRAPRDITPQTWQPGGENYIFLSLGAATNPGRYQWEVKTTVNSDSQLRIADADGAEAIIQAARIGPHFILLRKAPNGAWVVHQRYYRPDLPTRLQVGLTSYTDWNTCQRMTAFQHNSQVITAGNPDVVAMFDYVRFRRPSVPADLAGKPLADPRAVPDADLLRFLGDSAAGPEAPVVANAGR